MSRWLTIPSQFPLRVLTLSARGGVWEEPWSFLQSTGFGSVVSHTTRRTLEAAILGHTAPLQQGLGLPPEGVLAKLPGKLCQKRRTCTFHNEKTCQLHAKALPWCFIPSDFPALSAEQEGLVMELISAWRQKSYVIIVDEDYE